MLPLILPIFFKTLSNLRVEGQKITRLFHMYRPVVPAAIALIFVRSLTIPISVKVLPSPHCLFRGSCVSSTFHTGYDM